MTQILLEAELQPEHHVPQLASELQCSVRVCRYGRARARASVSSVINCLLLTSKDKSCREPESGCRWMRVPWSRQSDRFSGVSAGREAL